MIIALDVWIAHHELFVVNLKIVQSVLAYEKCTVCAETCNELCIGKPLGRIGC